jgi:tRNA G18 (ribose-2'-O)-methylase SpoU
VIARIGSLDDPRVADYAHVGDPAWLRAGGLVAAEGRLVVSRLVEDRRFEIVSMLLTPAALAALQPLVDDAPEVAAYVCDQAEMNVLTGFNFHRGCLALARRPAPLALTALAGARVLVGLEAVGNPDNIGGIFRSALALGADGVLLDDRCGDPLYRKAIRTSMGATLRVPFAPVPEWPAASALLRAGGFTVVALTPSPDAVDIEAARTVLRGRKLVLLLGSEGTGLTGPALDAADHRVCIAVEPRSDSLNVAVAAGIALHALRWTSG